MTRHQPQSRLQEVLGLISGLSNANMVQAQTQGMQQGYEQSAQANQRAQDMHPFQMAQARATTQGLPLQHEMDQAKLGQMQYEASPEYRGVQMDAMKSRAAEPQNEMMSRIIYALGSVGARPELIQYMMHNKLMQPTPPDPAQEALRQKIMSLHPQPLH